MATNATLSAGVARNFWYLTLLFIPLLTILGNALVILAVLGDKQLKKSVTNRYIAALAFSDFLIGLIPMPFAAYAKINGEQWNLGVGLCRFYVACDVTSSTASILHLVVISTDRYLAISWPAEYQRYARKATISYAIVLVWLISITLSIPVIMGKSILDTSTCWLDNPEYMIYSSLLSFYIPASVLTLVYVKIFRRIRLRQGIRALLKTSNASCASNQPFHLPFVVVHEISSDQFENKNFDHFSNESSNVLSASCDRRGRYSLVQGENRFQEGPQLRKHSPIYMTKSKTFPADFLDDMNFEDNLRYTSERGDETVESKIERGLQKNNREEVDLTRSKSTPRNRKSLHDHFAEKHHRISIFSSERNHRRSSRIEKDPKSIFYPSPEKMKSLLNGTAICEKCRTDEFLIRASSEKGLNSNQKGLKSEADHRRKLSLSQRKCEHIDDFANDFWYIDEFGDDQTKVSEQKRSKKILDLRDSSLEFENRFYSDFRQSSTDEENNSIADQSNIGILESAYLDFGLDASCLQTRESSVCCANDDEEAVACLPSSLKAKAGLNLKKLANRLTSMLQRITETQALTKEKKATKLVALILGVFVISWLPFFTFNTMRGICLSATSSTSDCGWLSSHIFFFTSWLGYANSGLNPILYGLVNKQFRSTYKRTTRRLIPWKSRR